MTIKRTRTLSLILILGLLGLYQNGFGQQILKGVVIDSLTREAIPFANLIAVGSNKGTSTDLNGSFSFNVPAGSSQLKVSYVGYHPKTLGLPTDMSKLLYISLSPTVIQKQEIVILKNANPAHRIIKLAVKNKPKNNPENIVSFTYQSHNKLIVTPDPDKLKLRKPKTMAQLEAETDSSIRKLQRLGKIKATAEIVRDTAYYARLNKRKMADSVEMAELRRFVDTSYLFLNETFTERKFKRPNQSNEKVLATRTSGFPSLALAAIGTRFQPFGFYKDAISLLGKDYINPISTGSTRRYDFTLVQTRIDENGDTTFVINYEPYDDANINGLKGQVSINSKGYAIQNITAKVADDKPLLDFSIKQMYEVVDGKYWFPTQLHTDFNFESATANDVPVIGIVRTYLGKIKTDAGLSRFDFIEEELEIPEIATNFPLDKMKALRLDSSTYREQNTYVFLDSIIKKEAPGAIDVVNALEYLALGAIPYKKVEFPLDEMINIRRAEGFRLGLGVRTNQLFSKHFTFGGYGAYGTRDGRFKYGTFADWKFSRYFDWHLKLAYNSDVVEPGSQQFLNYKNLLSTEGYRNFVISRLDYYESLRLSTNLRPFKFTGLELAIDRRTIRPGYDYNYNPTGLTGAEAFGNNLINYRTLELQGNISLVYGERYELFKGRRIMLERGYPAFYISVAKGLKTDQWGDLDYLRINGRVEFHNKSILVGNSYLTLAGGYTDRALPYGLLFNGMGANDKDIPVIMRNFFQTVGLYEYTHDQFGALFFYHSFEELLYKSKHEEFAPKPGIVHNMGWGTIRDPERYAGINTATMSGILYESGIQVNDLYRTKLTSYYLGLGLGVFQRYGPHALQGDKGFWTNTTLKLDAQISF